MAKISQCSFNPCSTCSINKDIMLLRFYVTRNLQLVSTFNLRQCNRHFLAVLMHFSPYHSIVGVKSYAKLLLWKMMKDSVVHFRNIRNYILDQEWKRIFKTEPGNRVDLNANKKHCQTMQSCLRDGNIPMINGKKIQEITCKSRY